MRFVAKEFGKRIAEARKRKGLTQVALAEALGISEKHMGAIESGRKVCSVDLIVELSEYLGVSTDYLLKGNDSEKYDIRIRLQEMGKQLMILSEKI